MKKISLALTLVGSPFLYAEKAPSWVNSYHPMVKDGVNAWVEVDVLYWKPWERSLVATNKASDVFTTDDFTKASVVHPHFHWDFGYRLRSGYFFASSRWDVEASWTHFSSFVSQHRSTGGSSFLGMFPIWSLAEDVIAGDYVFESALKWKLSLDVLDLQFDSYFKVLDWLEIKRILGLRAAWIKQHGDVTYQGGMFLAGILGPGVSLNGSDLIKMKNDYWGIGPTLGIAPRFILGKGFSLHGEAAVSGLYGFFTVKQKETYFDVTRSSHHSHESRWRCIADLMAGVQWKVLLHKARYALTFGADWEYHLFFHQFELKKDSFNLPQGNRDLSLQGVTFSTRFDF